MKCNNCLGDCEETIPKIIKPIVGNVFEISLCGTCNNLWNEKEYLEVIKRRK